MSEIEFLRRAVHCKEAQESATNDLSRAEWGAMAAQWLRLGKISRESRPAPRQTAWGTDRQDG